MRTDHPIIRVELRGGLGNQLFQAAAGYALARRLDGQLQFELFNFRRNEGRKFALAPFLGEDTLVTTPRTLIRRLTRKVEKLIGMKNYIYTPNWNGPCFKERSFAYDVRIQCIKGSCYLIGYFQSWRYFEDCAAEVKRLFDPEKAASNSAKAFGHEMSPDALIVHIRGGDYLENKKINEVHGLLKRSYYLDAISRMKSKGRADNIYCFSDNMHVARVLLEGTSDITFVEGFSAADDMFLMSRGRSHIISNSTFSYWSAWLAPTSEPYVIAPKGWFSEKELKKVDISDLYPPDWEQIS